jgi:NADH-ubiquinone oxidoreductase chain 6
MILAFNNIQYHVSTVTRLASVTSVTWDGYLAEVSHITSIGNILYSNYSIWLILTSLILILAMVGSIVITIKQKN